MTIQEQLLFCKTCHNRQFDASVGILCGLTHQKPNFVDSCQSYNIDIEETKRLKANQEAAQYEEQVSGGSEFFGPEKTGVQKGMVGGIVMMLIAVVWFVVGYAAGYIFFYPPILFVIGLFAFLKGILTGNISGQR